jgi:stringent starvation protein B
VSPITTKPYLIRAIYEWCSDCGYTPYLSVRVDPNTRVPAAYVKRGEIVLNIGHLATRNLTISNDRIQFSARFDGVSQEISIPMEAVAGIFSRENGQGMLFELPAPPQTDGVKPASGETGPPAPGEPPPTPSRRKANLKVVK